jgi:hypothetical protein
VTSSWSPRKDAETRPGCRRPCGLNPTICGLWPVPARRLKTELLERGCNATQVEQIEAPAGERIGAQTRKKWLWRCSPRWSRRAAEDARSDPLKTRHGD